MGMTINESRQLLSQYQKLLNSLNGDYKLSQVQISELSHSIGTALDIMRKYKQIEEIYERFQKDGGYYHHMAWLDVMEVVEDGKID